ncbi:MAG: hypothetical protein KDD45_11520, partial [Bdellovibrionales bacterium]|nr:hypothetical protein [Bdellovibrionales bacterium]
MIAGSLNLGKSIFLSEGFKVILGNRDKRAGKMIKIMNHSSKAPKELMIPNLCIMLNSEIDKEPKPTAVVREVKKEG